MHTRGVDVLSAITLRPPTLLLRSVPSTKLFCDADRYFSGWLIDGTAFK
jgi:hypothetical protein